MYLRKGKRKGNSMQQTRFAWIGATLLCGVILTGCGSGNGSAPTRSAFAGAWSGPYNGSVSFAAGIMTPQTGVLSATIGNDGKFTGGLEDTSAGAILNTSEPLSGTIGSNGAVTANLVTGSANVTYTVTGAVTKNAAGHLTGTLTENLNGSDIGSITIDLTPQTAAQ
jgi:hypothetical protein